MLFVSFWFIGGNGGTAEGKGEVDPSTNSNDDFFEIHFLLLFIFYILIGNFLGKLVEFRNF